MADGSPIEWLNVPGYKPSSWNPTRGCSRQGPGCDNCYAMGQAHRFSGPGKPFEGLTTIRNGKVDWNGVARFVPEILELPLRWRNPRAVFVDSMSDLFHPGISFEQIAAVFGVMAACSQHLFMVLTKQPKRAREFFTWCAKRGEDGVQLFPDDEIDWRIRQLLNVSARRAGADMNGHARQNHGGPWPLQNVWLLASIWDEPSADKYLPDLLACPAVVHGVSAEPLLAATNLRRISIRDELELDALTGRTQATTQHISHSTIGPRLSWVIVGGESGNGARPMQIDWMRAIVHQCREAGTACFVKQLGARPIMPRDEWERGSRDSALGHLLLSPKWDPKSPPGLVTLAVKGKGGDLSTIPGEWPREFPT